MLAHKLLEFWHQAGVLPKRQFSLDPFLQRREAGFLQSVDPGLRERVISKVGKRRSTPERQPFAEELSSVPRITLAERSRALIDERLKAVLVDLSWRDVQHVAVPARHQQPVTQCPPQVRDVPVHDLRGGCGRTILPQRVNKSVSRNRLTTVQDQHHQERPLLRAAKLQLAISVDHLEPPQNLKFDHRLPPATVPPLELPQDDIGVLSANVPSTVLKRAQPQTAAFALAEALTGFKPPTSRRRGGRRPAPRPVFLK